MRLVVDTNIFVSAALKEASWPAETIRWIATYGGLLKSAITEQELLAVLQRPAHCAENRAGLLRPAAPHAGRRGAGDDRRTRRGLSRSG